MHDQTNVAEILPFDDIDDVSDVGVEIDVLAEKMRALAQASQRRRKYVVAFLLQKVRDPPPHPTTAECAVDQHEGLGRALRARRTSEFAGGSRSGHDAKRGTACES
jgi:hypothetical protein